MTPHDDEVNRLHAENVGLAAQRDALLDACIFGDWINLGKPEPVHYWRIGNRSGHEPTRELARSAVMRAAKIADADLRGTVTKYEGPFDPACPAEDWEATREETP